MSTQKAIVAANVDNELVSIPLRGRCNVNVYQNVVQPLRHITVSIPLRGRCNVNNVYKDAVEKVLALRFHPLAGKM